MLSGAERFFIELIRVNPSVDVFGAAFTQAQIIAVALVALGILGLALLSRGSGKRAGGTG